MFILEHFDIFSVIVREFLELFDFSGSQMLLQSDFDVKYVTDLNNVVKKGEDTKNLSLLPG